LAALSLALAFAVPLLALAICLQLMRIAAPRDELAAALIQMGAAHGNGGELSERLTAAQNYCKRGDLDLTFVAPDLRFGFEQTETHAVCQTAEVVNGMRVAMQRSERESLRLAGFH
jgi:hypothetical protein